MAERVPPTVTAAEDVSDEPPNRDRRKYSSSFEDENWATKLAGGEEEYDQQFTPEEEKELSTYVVQIPKDQIYRVPPPENAKIVERFRNPVEKNRRPCCTRVCWTVLLLLAICAAIGVTLMILHKVYSPRAAVFSVAKVVVKNKKSPRAEYEITMNAKNPNYIMEINYQSDGEGLLYYKKQKLATGKFPKLDLESSDSRNVNVILAGRSSMPPEGVAKSMNDGKSERPISLQLKLKLKGEMNLGAMNLWSKEMNLVCDFQVSTLRKGTKVLSQKCDSQIK